MINQAYHTLDYSQDYAYTNPFPMRPIHSFSSKLRNTPYDAPPRNQVFSNQAPQLYQNNYQLPAFTINQPMLPFTLQNNRQTPNQDQINLAKGIECLTTRTFESQHPTTSYHSPETFQSDNNTEKLSHFTLKFANYIKELKPNVSILTLKNCPLNAFEHGIRELTKTKKFYLALHNVDIEFDIKSERAKERLKKEYDIDNTLRMVKKSTVYSNFTNQAYNKTNFQQNNLISLVKFMIEMFKNPSQVTEAGNEDPTPILNLIAQSFGQDFSRAISTQLFRSLDQNDPNMANPNCQSLNGQFKRVQIENALITHEIDIFSLNETFFKPTDNFHLKNYKIFRKDRAKREEKNNIKKGGRVAQGI
ncbi:hypothetical protein BpHYR1_015248 [Brachionus plicatilis]|uniref:Uncharacterized protein n=1 Tax=Brachionus plicatilis TaxID=10195 RepID=A0A3M7Q4I1_BRAPC|nr:hypothetical protein BpHYR1_015248 [Brachionus plicatilis]